MLNKKLLFILAIIFSINLNIKAQDNPRKIIAIVNQKFAKVKDYTADGNCHFDIPSVKLGDIKVNVLYKSPNKFKMKAKGIFFMPKQNPTQNIAKILADTGSYTAVYINTEIVNGVSCKIVSVLPTNSGDFVLGKFWIDAVQGLVMKSEITTKNAGTIVTESKYNSQKNYALPDAITIFMDVNKFKIPKIMALDLNKSKKEITDDPKKKQASKITITFSNYKINGNLEDKAFITE
jgi:hypothetical protein